MRLRLAVVLIFFSGTVYGQSDIDSLRQLIRGTVASRDFKSLSNHYAQLGYLYINEGRYDSAIHYYKLSLKLEKISPNVELLASSLNALGTAYSVTGEADSSIAYYDKALTAYTTVNDTLHAAVIETNLSILFKNLGVYDKALEYAFRSIRRHEQLQEWQSMASSLSNVSLVYFQIKDYENALQYGYESLKKRQEIKHTRGIGLSLQNIGEIYQEMGQSDSALSNFTRALEVKRRNNDRKYLANTLLSLGTNVLQKGSVAQARRYYEEALQLKKEFKDPAGVALCYNKLAKVALTDRDWTRTGGYLQEAEQILSTVAAPEVRKENLELKISFYEATGKSSLAAMCLKQLLQVKDSLLSGEKAKSMNALEIRFETDKKEQQIRLLEKRSELAAAELRINQYIIYGMGGGIFLLLVIAGLIYNNFRVARKGKSVQELLNRELNHRVKNNLQLLGSVLSLQSQELTDENAVIAVRSNQSRVNAMALIHRKLYENENDRTIQLQDYLHELIRFLFDSYNAKNEGVRLVFDVPATTVDVDKAIPLGLIVNEVVINSLKYAFHSQREPVIEVQARLMDESDLYIRIKDNGSGMITKPVLGSDQSFGIKMIHLLTKELRGKITIDSEDGTCVQLKIPIR